MLLLTTASVPAQSAADRKDWIQLFNGKDLDGWVMKITGYPLRPILLVGNAVDNTRRSG